jgi:hypothetical protein
MLRFRRPEVVLAFLAGVMFIALWETLLGYQAANCSYQQEYQAKAEPTDSRPTAQNKHSSGGEEHGHKTISEPLVCGVAGIPTAARQFMNRNEGFFVASFTLALVLVTGWLVWATLKLWEAGEKQFGLLSKSAAAQSRDMQASIQVAKRSADVAERALILTDRPWVDIRVEITGALKFDPVEGCLIKIKLTLVNIGRSPAIGLGYFIEFCPSISQAIERHQKMVESTRFMIKEGSFGSTRFPNDPFNIEMAIGATPSQIEASLKEGESGLVEPYIVACAYYGLPTGGRFRYTTINKAIWLKGEAEGFAPNGEYAVEDMSVSSFNTGETT